MSDTTAIVKRSPLDFLENKKFCEKLATAIPNAMLKADRFLQLALTLIKGSPKLMKCSPISLMACVMEAAQLGLELDPVLGNVYMVPFADEATLIIGYKGFAQLMYQSGQVVGISAEVVRPKDKFKRTLGTNRGLLHEPAPIPKKDNYETWLGAYAVARMISETYEFEYMEAVQIENIRNRSRSWQAWLKEQKQTPWITDDEQMWRKTPLRRLAKRMPRSTTDNRGLLLRAVMIDELSERKGKLLKPTEDGFVIEEDFLPSDEPAIQPTTEDLSGKLQESIDVVNAGRKGGKPGREPKKPPKSTKLSSAEKSSAQTMDKGPGPVKANIPPASAIDDPLLTVSQQTAIYHAAMQSGWQVPEEFSKMLQKDFKLKSIQQVRNSQFAEMMRIAKDGK